MTTSANSSFDLSRQELVDLSFEDVVGAGSTPDSAQRAKANQLLNMVVKSIDKDGVFLWRTIRREATITAGTAAVTLATDVLAVDEPMNFRITGETARTQLTAITRDFYLAIPDRTVTGRPRQFFFEETLTAKTLLLDPVPEDGGTLEYAAILKGKDMDTESVTADFPQKWLMCLRYGLSAALCPSYGQMKLMGGFTALFNQEKAEALADGSERGGIQFSPFAGGY